MLKPLTLVLATLLVSACSSIGKYHLEVGDEVRMQRGFFEPEGQDAEILSHTIAVGYPDGLSYVYDLETGRVVGFWRDAYIDVRGMWAGRGSGRFSALGDVRFLGISQPLQAPGDSGDKFRSRGYSIDETSGVPSFHYRYASLEVTDRIDSLSGDSGFRHSIRLSALKKDMVYQIVMASSIIARNDGSYAIDDNRYVVSDIRGGTAYIAKKGGKETLVLDIDESTLRYSVSW